MYNREHVTTYLLSFGPVVGFRMEYSINLHKVFLGQSKRASLCGDGRRSVKGTGNDTGSGMFEAQCEIKGTYFGCVTCGNGSLGSFCGYRALLSLVPSRTPRQHFPPKACSCEVRL